MDGCPCGIATPALLALMVGAAYGTFRLGEWLLGTGILSVFGI